MPRPVSGLSNIAAVPVPGSLLAVFLRSIKAPRFIRHCGPCYLLSSRSIRLDKQLVMDGLRILPRLPDRSRGNEIAGMAGFVLVNAGSGRWCFRRSSHKAHGWSWLPGSPVTASWLSQSPSGRVKA
jgi:hypothetical protein